MAQISFTVNGIVRDVDVSPDMPLLWVLRDVLKLTGTKYSCGQGLCGSCTVHVDGVPQKSCVLPVSKVAGKEILTIEGLGATGLHPLQQAWLDEEVSQCGYCQPGQLMQAAALLKETPQPSDEEIDTAMKGILCRCGSYQRIRKAIHVAAREV